MTLGVMFWPLMWPVTGKNIIIKTDKVNILEVLKQSIISDPSCPWFLETLCWYVHKCCNMFLWTLDTAQQHFTSTKESKHKSNYVLTNSYWHQKKYLWRMWTKPPTSSFCHVARSERQSLMWHVINKSDSRLGIMSI